MLRVAFLTLYPVETASTRQRIHNNVRRFPPDLEAVILSSNTAAAMRRAQTGGRCARLMVVLEELSRRLVQLWQARGCDVIVVQKGLTVMNLRGLPDLLFALGRPVVYDFDDAVHLEPVQTVRSRWLRWLFDPRQVVGMLPRFAAVVAGNRFLAAVAAAHNSEVVVLGTPMDTDRYRTRPVRRSPPVVIGWSGSTSTHRYVGQLAPILRRVAERLPEIEFRVISNGPEGIDWGQFAGVPTAFVRWRLETLVEDLLAFDVGLMPLDDDEWSRCKCGGKILQYMACGIPAVASPVGINPEVIEDGVSGFLPRDVDTWVEAITRLALDPDLRERMGRAGRRSIELHHSNRVIAPRLATLLKRVGAARRDDRRAAQREPSSGDEGSG